MLHTVLGDRMIEDLHNLRQRNDWIAQGLTPVSTSGRPTARCGPSASPPARRTRRVGRVRRDPQAPVAVAQLVAGVGPFALERVLRGLGEGTGQRELLSYVLFDDEYFAAQIDIGANAARAVLKQLDG